MLKAEKAQGGETGKKVRSRRLEGVGGGMVWVSLESRVCSVHEGGCAAREPGRAGCDGSVGGRPGDGCVVRWGLDKQ